MDTTRRQQERAVGRATGPDRLRLFAVMWALASLWHLLGDPGGAPAWAQAALALALGLVLWRPGAVVPLGLLAAAGVAVAWEEAPALGDHWLLASLVNVAILLCIGVAVLRRRLGDRTDLAERLFPAARLCLLGAYGFAAFAKLNSAFFDRGASCAVFLYRQTTGSIGLEGLQLGGTAWLERAVILAVAGIQVAVPLLLLVRRTRSLGVVLAMGFHLVVALDRTASHVESSAVLFALLVLLLPPSSGQWTAERVGSVGARLALRDEALPGRVRLAAVMVPTLVGLLVAVDAVDDELAFDLGWWSWQVFALVALTSAARHLRQSPGPSAVRLLPYHALYALVPLLVVANGVAPYVELKTGDTWTTYSNLRTVDGDTNHLVLPRTLPVSEEQADLVEILDTNDPMLALYRASDLALTWDRLRAHLHDRPGVAITYRRGSKLVALARASDEPELVAPLPLAQEKLLPFTPVDLAEPEPCRP